MNSLCAPVVVATLQTVPEGLASDGQYVYFTEWGTGVTTGVVWETGVASAPGAANALAKSQTYPWGVTAYKGTAYWTADSLWYVEMCSVGSSTITPIGVKYTTPYGIANDGVHVYWSSAGDGTLSQAGIDGSSPTVFVQGLSKPQALAINSTTAYVIVGGGKGIMTATLGSGMVLPLPAPGNATVPTALGATDSDLYWTDSQLGGVLQVPAAGGTTGKLLAPANKPTAMTLDTAGKEVYFADAVAGTVAKVATSSPYHVTSIAMGQGVVSLMALDQANVYWVSGNSVLRLPRQ